MAAVVADSYTGDRKVVYYKRTLPQKTRYVKRYLVKDLNNMADYTKNITTQLKLDGEQSQD